MQQALTTIGAIFLAAIIWVWVQMEIGGANPCSQFSHNQEECSQPND
ncbi:MAG: hypothetical protein WC679_01135 [Bacteroidales bacterium]|jgi:hypothetical protein